MRAILRFYSSPAGKKVLMGFAGFFLMSFLLVHLFINLFILRGEAAGDFDAYAEFMATYPLVRPVEIALFLGFALHILLGAVLYLRNRRVRGTGYAVDHTGRAADLPSRLAVLTGGGLLVFLAYHISTFFVRSRFGDAGVAPYRMVADAFADPFVSGLYLAALLFLGFHLKHGFQSAFQTLGLRHPKYRRLIDLAAVLFWLVVPLCFAAIPLSFLLEGVLCR